MLERGLPRAEIVERLSQAEMQVYAQRLIESGRSAASRMRMSSGRAASSIRVMIA